MTSDLIKWIQSFHSDTLDQFFILVTMLGEEYFYIAILSMIYWNINKQTARFLVLILALSATVNGAIKEVVGHSRPIGEVGIRSKYTDTAEGASFPSGHTQNATAFFGAAGLAAKNPLLWIGFSILIVLVAISRLYLGVHWPLDVIAGIGFGILSIVVGKFIYEKSEKKGEYLPYFVILVLAVVSVFFLTSSAYIKAVALLLGYLVGYFFEENFLQFDVRAPLVTQIMKYLIGLAVTGAIFLGLKMVLPTGVYWDGLRYFLTIFFVMFGAPALFMVMKLSRHRIF
ncbi:MAG: phosphatase PAP2 family protein [Clostridiales bacterium]|nr:phosphatase PAP2 family protein [Clostridiales bacterium]